MVGCSACGESNPERARFCLACGQPLGGVDSEHVVRRNVSIIFADLVDSTKLGEALDAETLRHVTGRYFDTMCAAVERHEGTVEKFIGDAVVAIFGVPRVHEDDAVRAVRAAANMRDSLVGLNEELQRDLGVTVRVRIGVNTGEVVVGSLRAGGSPATGDAINVAARLEQVAGAGEVLIGESTRRLVRDQVTVEAVEPLQLKGKTEPVVAWRLLDVTGLETARTRDRLSAFTGRDSQLGLLDAAFSRVERERVCQLVTVLGTAGIGKSRLAEEFVSSHSAATVLTGHCLSYGEGATYWPLREAVLSAIGLIGGESAEVVETRLAEALGETANAANVVTRLLALVAINRDQAVPEDVPWAVRTFLERLAIRRPVVLIVDDLHWAEPGLIDVLEHIADWSRDAPIMLLGLARPEFDERRPSWAGVKRNTSVVRLAALDDADVALLVAKHNLPEAVQRQIVETAGGNPLFVQQLIALLVDDGLATSVDGIVSWLGGPSAHLALTMPPSVSALLSARIDRLPEAERATLGRAAVMGTVFYVDALASLTEAPSPDIRELLDHLIRKELVRAAISDLAGLLAYQFVHVLVRDAAYEGLAKATRADWHEQFADWLAALGSNAVPDEIVGRHLASAWQYRLQLGRATDRTRDLAARASYRLAAASRRLDLTDIQAAAALMERAIAMLEPEDPERFDRELSLAQQRIELGELDEARELLRDVTEGADERLATLAGALRWSPNVLTADDRAESGEIAVRQAIRSFHAWGDDRALALGYLVQADLASMRGRFSRTSDLLELALKHGEAAGDAGSVARARSQLSIAFLFGPTPAEEGITMLQRMLTQSGNDPRVRAETEQVTCVLHAMCGRFGQARELAAAAREHLAEVGYGLFLANIAQSTGHVEELIGDLDAAEREYERSCADLEEIGESAYLSTVAGLAARLFARRGKLTQASAALELARKHGSADDAMTQSLVLQTAGLLAAAGGDADLAHSSIAAAIGFQADGEMTNEAGETYLVAAAVERSLERPTAEQAHLVAAQRLFDIKGNVVRAREVADRLAQLAVR